MILDRNCNIIKSKDTKTCDNCYSYWLCEKYNELNIHDDNINRKDKKEDKNNE